MRACRSGITRSRKRFGEHGGKAGFCSDSIIASEILLPGVLSVLSSCSVLSVLMDCQAQRWPPAWKGITFTVRD
jgi:hypothetical protein